MATVKRCDCCGKEFDYGFLVSVDIQGGYDFKNVVDDRLEVDNKDICRECYYKFKKLCMKGSDENGQELCESKSDRTEKQRAFLKSKSKSQRWKRYIFPNKD